MMALGAGKYDDLCMFVRMTAGARGAVVLLADGRNGSGFSVQGTAEFIHDLPRILRETANAVEKDLPILPKP